MMSVKRLILATVVCIASLTAAMAQEEATYRREIGVGIGMTNYLGDFNGSLTSGMQPQLNVLYRRVYSAYSALKLDMSMTTIKGASMDVETYYPDYVQTPYNFKRTLMDLNAIYEYNFLPYGTGLDYRGSKRLTPFIFIGLGATMATGEGQTKVTANVPLGVGIKYKLAERWNMGLEWAAHFSMSDVLDGVKDPYRVESSGMFKNTDCYSSLRLTLTYSFSAVCPTCNKDY